MRGRFVIIARVKVPGSQPHYPRVVLAGTEVILGDFAVVELASEEEGVVKRSAGF